MNADTATPKQLVQYILSNSESDSLLTFTRDVQAQMVTIGITGRQFDALRKIATGIQNKRNQEENWGGEHPLDWGARGYDEGDYRDWHDGNPSDYGDR